MWFVIFPVTICIVAGITDRYHRSPALGCSAHDKKMIHLVVRQPACATDDQERFVRCNFRIDIEVDQLGNEFQD